MKLKNLFFALVTLVCVAAVPAQAQENVEATPATQQEGPLVLTLERLPTRLLKLRSTLSAELTLHCGPISQLRALGSITLRNLHSTLWARLWR